MQECPSHKWRLRLWRFSPLPVLLLTLPLTALPRLTIAADLAGYASLTTDYVFRGVTYSDSDPAAQLGADLSLDNGLFAGIWASTIDIDNPPFSERDTEFTYYAGYRYDLSKDWTIGGTAILYRYPGAKGRVQYDYEEYMLSLNFRDRAWFEYAYSPDLFHSGHSTDNYRLHVESPWRYKLTGSAGLGYYDTSRLAGSGYAYWELGVTRPVGNVDLDLRFHDTDGWLPIISNPDRAESRVVLSARFQF